MNGFFIYKKIKIESIPWSAGSAGSARLLRRRAENYSLIFAAACAANIILLKSGCGHHGIHVGLNFAGEFNVKIIDQHLGHGR